MQEFFITSRGALDDAMALIDEYGADAALAAAERAERSRDVGNLSNFCHWRQLERVVALLASGDVIGEIH
jgi:hypothetical protein